MLNLPVVLLSVGSEERLGFGVPDHKTHHCVLVVGGPVVLVYPRKDMVAWMIAVESPVLVEKVVFGQLVD